MKKFAFSLPEKSAKKDFIFNMYGSMLMSFVSVFLLVAVSQILGEYAAGIFSISYSTAQMFYTIGAYEVRNIQVTDAKGEFEFADCLAFRMITTAVMVVVSECFVIFKGFDAVKSSVIMLLCVYMAFVSLSEVFQGNAHKNGYLYISGFSLGTSVLLASVAFIITLIVTKSLIISIIPMIAVMFVWIFAFDLPFTANFDKPIPEFRFNKIKSLFLHTTPLIISVFANQYSLNCPKYAIDKCLTDLDQSHYGYLVMPAFCINLLSMFVFRPNILLLSQKWNARDYKGFNKISALLFGWIAIATLIVLAGGYFFGIPILNVLYGTDLTSKKIWLLVLLVGGGFSAAATLGSMIVAVTRKQNYALAAYLAATVAAVVLPNILVKNYGFAGAPVSYLLINVVLFIALFVVLFVTVFSKSLHKGKTQTDKSNNG